MLEQAASALTEGGRRRIAGKMRPIDGWR